MSSSLQSQSWDKCTALLKLMYVLPLDPIWEISFFSIDVLSVSAVNQLKYNEIDDKDQWRIPIIKEITDMKFGSIDPPEGLTPEDLEEMHVQRNTLLSFPILFLAVFSPAWSLSWLSKVFSKNTTDFLPYS